MNSWAVIIITEDKRRENLKIGSKKKDIPEKELILSMGHNYISIQQCDFNKEIKPLCHEFYDEYLPSYYTKNRGALTDKIRYF